MSDSKLKIINIMLSSLDGKIAFHANESSVERNKNNFTCPEDFERMRKLVSECDVVFHGARSIESEKGAFRVADLRKSSTYSNIQNEKNEPEWIIFTQSGQISFQSPFWKQEGILKSLFFVSSFDLNEFPILKVEEKEFNFGKINCYLGSIGGLIQYLTNKQYKKAALLGGGKLNTAFWESNLIDALYLTLNPFIVGGEETPTLLNLKKHLNKKLQLVQCKNKDGFVFLDYETIK